MMKKENVADKITSRIIEALEQNKIPWLKTWTSKDGMSPISLSTGKQYQGFNRFWLGFAGEEYNSNIWGTFNQIKAKKGMVNKGEKATPIIFYQPTLICGGNNDSKGCGKFYPKKNRQKSANKCPSCQKDTDGADKEILNMRNYNVFNTQQATWEEGKDPYTTSPKPKVLTNGEVAVEAVKIVDSYINNESVTLNHGSSYAAYNPTMDKIIMPDATEFINGESYAVTLYHEVIHSTGHEDRLDRKGITDLNAFGSHEYSYEEMIAEMGSQMLALEVGHETENTVENAKAYCQGWMKVLKGNSKFIIQASASAQKAVNLVLKEVA